MRLVVTDVSPPSCEGSDSMFQSDSNASIPIRARGTWTVVSDGCVYSAMTGTVALVAIGAVEVFNTKPSCGMSGCCPRSATNGRTPVFAA
jgi:hypothetical protein